MSEERTWTKSQQSAIEHSGSDLLLSAAAGSGKTATLTARLIRLLCSSDVECNPSEVLCVTFTDAASAEMRSRLLEAARLAATKNDGNKPNEKARHLLTVIDSVQICTMHSFCLYAIRPILPELGFPADVRICDETEGDMLRKSAMRETVNRFFNDSSMGKMFGKFADIVAVIRDDASIENSLLSIAKKVKENGITPKRLNLYADKMDSDAEKDIFLTDIGRIIKSTVQNFANHYLKVFRYYSSFLKDGGELERVYMQSCCGLIDDCEKLLSCSAYDEMRQFILSCRQESITLRVKKGFKTEEAEEFLAYRKLFKSQLESIRSDFFIFSDKENTEAFHRTAEFEKALSMVLDDFEACYMQRKKDRGVLDFNDLERMCHNAFVGENGEPTEYAKRLGERYKYIFIDEFQDTNKTQNEIFRSISANAERFMVGDVKQSIYSFRGGDPSVFSAIRDSFGKGEGGKYIFMSENFRSSSNVLSYANAVSDVMFPFSDTPYDSTDRLIYSRKGDDFAKDSELVLIESPEKDENGMIDDDYVSEPKYVASRIVSLLKGKDGNKVKPGDIAILLDSAKKAKGYIEALSDCGVNTDVSAKTNIYNDATVLSAMCILNAIVRPELDIQLLGAMKTAAFGFTLSETVKIRTAYPNRPMINSITDYADNNIGELADKCRAFTDKLRELGEYVKLLTPDAFVRYVIRKLSLENALAVGDVSADTAREKLRLVRNIARRSEKNGNCTLHSFLTYAEKVMESSKDSDSSGSTSDAVHIMTIHHSKGLEFPYVFLCEADARFNLNDKKEKIIFCSDGGVCTKLPDSSGLVTCDNILHRATSKIVNNRLIEEKMRVLYVAMTRAKEQLIITATVKDAASAVRNAVNGKKFASPHYAMSQTEFLPWILSAICEGNVKGCRIITSDSAVGFDTDCINSSYYDGSFDNSRNIMSDDSVDELENMIKSRIGFEYQYDYLKKIPAKLTVSKLYPEILDEESMSLDLTPIKFEDEAPMPEFMKSERKASFAEIGIATHVFLQFCDFSKLTDMSSEAVKNELDRLVRGKFISESYAMLVSTDKISLFLKSDLFERICHAKRVFREFRFNSSQKASKFTADEMLRQKLEKHNVDVIVQGVVDILFEDENGKTVLVDYKTDRIGKDERGDIEKAKKILRERHANQLSYYRDICGEMLDRPVDEVLIYSVDLGISVEI